MNQNNYFIITGAMGAGKTSLLNHIRSIISEGYVFIEEPAREILKEQRITGGSSVPEKNPVLFCRLMLNRMTDQYFKNKDRKESVIFDRGIPDIIVYAELFGLDKTEFMKAADEFKYNRTVFFLQGWRDIYVNDDERKMDFESAEKFGVNLKTIYEMLGYTVMDVPFVSVEKRAEFFLDSIDNFI